MMETQYFVKFIGDKNVALARAHNAHEAEVLRRNQYDACSRDFYQWVISNTAMLTSR